MPEARVLRRRRRVTDAELIWAVYTQEAPADIRLCQTYDEMTDHARAIWLDIAKRLLANGALIHVPTT
jgi:hypothetical protein